MWGTVLLLITSAWGLEGHFVYQGEQQTISTVRKETIYTGSAQGKERLAELREEGYSCSPKLQFYQCTLSLEPESLKDVFNPKAQDVVFGPIKALNTKYQGEGFLQYEADQTVMINGISFNKATYYELKEFVKVAVGTPDSGNYHSFIIGKNSLTSVEQKNQTESKWVYKTHWVEATLQVQEPITELE